jgi:hypothetical protein
MAECDIEVLKDIRNEWIIKIRKLKRVYFK